MFVGCARDSESFQDALPSLLEIYAKQVLNPQSDIDKSEKRLKLVGIF